MYLFIYLFSYLVIFIILTNYPNQDFASFECICRELKTIPYYYYDDIVINVSFNYYNDLVIIVSF